MAIYAIRGYNVEEILNYNGNIAGFSVRIVLSPNLYYHDFFFNEVKRDIHASSLRIMADVKGRLIVHYFVPYIDVL